MPRGRWLIALAVLAVLAALAGGTHPPAVRAANGTWTGKYYANTSLSGSPVVTRDDGVCGNCTSGSGYALLFGYDTFDGVTPPAPGVPPTNFSASWTRTDTYSAGTYRFTVTADDGVRIFVDGAEILNQWVAQPATTFFVDQALTDGSHTVEVDYYNGDNGGDIALSIQNTATLPPGWTGEYFANQNLSGTPVFTRNDPQTIAFQWNTSSPDVRIPNTQFSIRWTQTINFEEGVYSFTTTSDDGSRVYVDGQLVVNAWQDQDLVTTSGNIELTAGPHTVEVDYYQAFGGAAMYFDYQYRPDLGGFVTDAVATGLNLPTAFAMAPDGRAFIATKDGIVHVLKNGSLLPTPFYTVSPVNNFHDRGLIGIALDPNFESNGYVYLGYTYDVNPSDQAGPKTDQVIRVTANGDVADPNSKLVLLGSDNGTSASPTCDIDVTAISTSGVWTTSAPHRLAVGNIINLAQDATGATPAVLTGDYTVSSVPSSTTFKVSKLNSLTTAATGAVFSKKNADCLGSDSESHSIGALKFGPDGMLYVAVGDGASFNTVDPLALRALNVDRLNGKILRVNPANGQGLSNNPYYDGNPNDARSKVWAMGLRNPFRYNFQPGTNTIFVGDVGWDTWEEINVIPATGGANFGWPCYEGNFQQGGYSAFSECQSLYTSGAEVNGIYSYDHNGGSAAVVGGVFTGANGYNSVFQNRYWFADYAQNVVETFRVDASNQMVTGSLLTFTNAGDGPVDLEIGPNDGDVYYLAINAGELRHIHFVGGNRPPVAKASATPSNGLAPLTVNFSSAGSNDPDQGQTITYDWDFGDGSPHSTVANPVHEYAANGVYTATLTVTDPLFLTDQATVKITVGNTPPVPAITSPAAGSHYDIGDTITFAGTALDAQDGAIPASSLSWNIVLWHCSDDTFTSCHTHPYFSTTGAGGSFVVSDHGDFTYFVITLTATDSGGLAASTSVTITPNRVAISFASNPTGASISVDGTTQNAPFTHSVPRKSAHSLFAASPQTIGATPMQFSSWSDGGANPHSIVAAADATYTVSFIAQATPTPTATPLAGTPTVTPTPCQGTICSCPIWRADINGDGTVTILDLSLVAAVYGQKVPPAPARYDLNGDNSITILDLSLIAASYGKTTGSCPS